MDSVRFGRILGQGARQAAKTLVSAVDAATAPDPRQTSAGPPAAPSENPSAATATSPSSPPASLQPAPAAAPTISASPASVAFPSTTPSAREPRPAAIPAPRTPPRASSAATTARGLAEGSRRFGRAVWTPAVRLSGVLWLELTGVFFALFALVAGIAAWRLRSAVHFLPASAAPSAAAASASDDRTRLLFAAGMVLVFGYFSFSSFLKASRRSRRS